MVIIDIEISVQPWALICDILLSRNLKAGTAFQQQQGTGISLLCEVHLMPHTTMIFLFLLQLKNSAYFQIQQSQDVANQQPQLNQMVM